MTHLHKVKSKLVDLQYTVEEAKTVLVPKMKVSLNEDEMIFMSKLIAKLEDHQDVTEIYDNIE